MKFYISNHTTNFIKKNYKTKFSKTNTYYFDFKKMVLESKLTDYRNDVYEKFILVTKIVEQFRSITKNRRFSNIVYVLEKSKIDEGLIEDLKTTFEENSIYFTEYILIDNIKDIETDVYKIVDEII